MNRAVVPPIAGAPRPRWSVMIPTYNCARYLEASAPLRAHPGPGPEAMQIEVVDDHSPADDPEEVVTRLGQGRVAFHRQPENVGVVGNLNTCLQRARGELVHVLHGDDLVLDGFYRTSTTACGSIPMPAQRIAATSTSTRTTAWLDVAPHEPASSGILTEGARFLAAEQRVMTPCIVVRRSVYEQLGGFDTRLACAEDWEMWVRVASRFPGVLRRAAACVLPGARRLEHRKKSAQAAGAWTTRGWRSSSSPLLRPDRTACRQTNRILALCPVGTGDGAEPAVRRVTPPRRARSCESSGGWRSHRGPRQGSPAWSPARSTPRGSNGSQAAHEARARRSASWTPPVNLVLVGCGAVARNYYFRRSNAPGRGRLGRSIRLFDPTSARAREVAALLPAGAVAPSWEDVLKGPEELAIVASPPVAHPEQVRALLEHGKHILCEKPFVLDRAAGKSLVDLARRARAPLRGRHGPTLLALGLPAQRVPFGGTPHPARVARGQPLSLAGRLPRVLRARGREPTALGHRVACRRPACLVARGPARGRVPRRRDGRVGDELRARARMAGRLQRRGAVEPRVRAPRGLVVERPARCPRLSRLVEGGVFRGSEEAAAPDFEEWIPGAAAPAGRTFADCFELQLQNVLAAVRGVAPLWAPAEDVVESVGALARAEAGSRLLEAPWLGQREVESARTLRAGAWEVASC